MVRRRWKYLAGLVALAASLIGVQIASAAGSQPNRKAPAAKSTALAGRDVKQRVILLLKNQEAALPATGPLVAARRHAIVQSQAPLQQQMTAAGATGLHSYTVVNAIAADVPAGEAAALAGNPAVAKVIPDAIIHGAPTRPAAGTSAATGTTPLPGSCPAPGKVELDPQALETIHADSDDPSVPTARSLGFTGAGVKVGFIADGIDVNNTDLIRPDGSKVIVDYKDFTGEGTGVADDGGEAFGDASSIAAQGANVYDVSHYSALPLNQPCRIRIEGVAPGSSLVALDVLGSGDTGYNSSLLQAIDYAVTVDHVQILNESLGGNPYPDDPASLDLIKATNDQAVAAGTTVVVSTGDAGVTNTIGSPATDPEVISAGASTTYRLDAQIGYGGARFPGVTGWLNDDVSSFSSGGFSQDGRTPDVVAPGELNWALCSTNVAIYADCVNFLGKPSPIEEFGGTSESAPLTAGVAALVYQAYAKTHGGAYPTPAVAGQIIASTTDDVGSPADQQGSGLVDAYQAVLAAESYAAPAQAAGATIVKSATQLNFTGQPGTTTTLNDTLTNTSSKTQTLTLRGRTLGAYQQLKRARVVLSDTASDQVTDWQGILDNVERVSFTVPEGQNRLSTSIAFQNASLTDLAARVRLTLVDPNGKLAAYSVPQGDGNYGNVQVTNPAAGNWTAYVYSRNSGDGGTTGPVVFAAESAGYAPFGQVSPSTLTLGPGQSKPVTIKVTIPSTPGDSSGAILLTSAQAPAFAAATTIPVVLRSLIPSGPASFSDTLTGGNGRELSTGQTFYYQLDVPSSAPELNATVKLANNPDNPFTALLVNPQGEPLASATNTLITDAAGDTANVIGAQLHALKPSPGRWTLIVVFAPQVSGKAISTGFAVNTDQTQVPATAPNLPDSGRTVLHPGGTYLYRVKIRNPGPSPELYFLDARLNAQSVVALSPLTSSTTIVPLTVNSNIPLYLVPTHTSSLFAQAGTSGPEPIQFDVSSPLGDPDFGSPLDQTVSASFNAAPIGQGQWAIAPTTPSPNGANPVTPEPVSTSMSAITRAFDPNFASATSDLWFGSVNALALNDFDPVEVGPGQTASIRFALEPAPGTPPGTKITGTLYLDDTNTTAFEVFSNLNGNELAAFPYRYTVK